MRRGWVVAAWTALGLGVTLAVATAGHLMWIVMFRAVCVPTVWIELPFWIKKLFQGIVVGGVRVEPMRGSYFLTWTLAALACAALLSSRLPGEARATRFSRLTLALPWSLVMTILYFLGCPGSEYVVFQIGNGWLWPPLPGTLRFPGGFGYGMVCLIVLLAWPLVWALDAEHRLRRLKDREAKG